MRAALLSIVSFALATSAACAQVDKEALRKAAQLPSVSVQFNFGVDPVRGWIVGFGKPNNKDEIKTLLTQMKGDASDADRYYRVGMLQTDKKDWVPTLTKAKDLYRQQLAKQPNDGHLLARLGTTLWELDENKEAEDLLRRAVQKAPSDWRCWVALGDLLDGKSGDVLPYKKGSRITFRGMGLEDLVKADIFESRPTPTQIAEARKLRKEARACYDKAVAVAPRDPKPHLERARFFAYNGMFEHTLTSFGKQTPAGMYMKFMTGTDVIADLQKAADLDPRNTQIVTLATIYSLVGLTLRAKEAEAGVIEQVATQTFAKAEKNLRNLSMDKDAKLASEAATMLGTLFLAFEVFDQKEEARGLFRRAIELNPDNLMAWDLAIGSAVKRKDDADAAALCEKRLMRQDSPKYRFMLAKIQEIQDKPAQAELHLRAGVKSFPDDALCQLGLAVLILKKSGDPTSLKQAGDHLERASKLMPKDSTGDLRHDFETTRAILLALAGNREQAAMHLRKVLEKDGEHSGAKQALKVLSGE